MAVTHPEVPVARNEVVAGFRRFNANYRLRPDKFAAVSTNVALNDEMLVSELEIERLLRQWAS